jgi:hypothetical protein
VLRIVGDEVRAHGTCSRRTRSVKHDGSACSCGAKPSRLAFISDLMGISRVALAEEEAYKALRLGALE